MIRLSGSNVHYFYYPIEFCLQKLASAGFHEMELYLGTPHIFIDRNIVDPFADIFSLARENEICITSVHPETISFRYTLCNPDPDWNRKSILAYRKCIEFASDNGIHTLNTDISGCFRDCDQDDVFAQVYGDLRELADVAADKDVHIVLETTGREFQGFLTDISSLHCLFGKLSEEYPEVFLAGLNWDSMLAADETPDAWFSLFGEKLQYIRFGNPDDLSGIRRACCRHGFQGVVQVYPPDDDALLSPDSFDSDLMKLAESDGG